MTSKRIAATVKQNQEAAERQLLPSERATGVVKERQKTHGHPYHNYSKFAKMVDLILDGGPCTPLKAVMIQIALKMCRELTNEHSDNLTDIAGYANVYEMVQERMRRLEAVSDAT